MEDKTIRNEVHFKIGLDGVEFDAKGDSAFIERERNAFEAKLLPLGVDAVTRTRGTPLPVQYIESAEQSPMLLTAEGAVESISPIANVSTDFSRTSLSSFLMSYGKLSDRDFALIAAYYDEKKNNISSFTSDSVKQYYADARRPKYSNISELLRQLVQKGYIMDAPITEQKTPKPYILTDIGIQYVEGYKPKESSEDKPKVTRARKPRPKEKSVYSEIDCDDLNLSKYPDVKSLKDFKEKMMMVLYIVTQEKKGEWFTVSDVHSLMTDIFGEAATEEQIKGVFRREKLWFKAENVEGNTKLLHRKLLNKGKEFAEAIVQADS